MTLYRGLERGFNTLPNMANAGRGIHSAAETGMSGGEMRGVTRNFTL